MEPQGLLSIAYWENLSHFAKNEYVEKMYKPEKFRLKFRFARKRMLCHIFFSVKNTDST